MKDSIVLIQNLLNICEGISAFAGILCWQNIKDYRIKSFVAYLIFIVAMEILGAYLKFHNYKEETSMLYSYVVIPVEFLFSYWFLYKNSDSSIFKKLSIVFSVVAVSINVVEILFIKNEKYFFISLSYICYSLFLVILVLFYLYHFIKSDRIINALSFFIFWVCCAYLIFYLGTFPLYSFYNYLYKVDKNLFNLYWKVAMFFNMIMYLMFAIGLIWTRKKSN